MLGALNVLVIAIGMAVMAGSAEVLTLVVMFGGIPGVITGGVLGWIAGQTATRVPWLRVVLLALPAVGVVGFLATEFDMRETIAVACIPTVTAALVLERWTRRVTPAPVPVATVRSMGA
jgi:hypothetical protein